MRSRLALASGQDLSEAAARGVWAHLAECIECRLEYSAYLSVRSALTTLTPDPVADAAPAGLQREILERIRSNAPPRRVRVGAWASFAAAAALLVLGVVLVRERRVQPPGLLERPPIEAVSTWPVDTPDRLIPLYYPAGLEARRQLDVLFERDGSAAATWIVGRDHRSR